MCLSVALCLKLFLCVTQKPLNEWLTLVPCGLILTKWVHIGSGPEVLVDMSLGLHFTPPQTLRWEEQCSQGRRVRGGGGLKLRLVPLEAWSITFLHCLSVVSICGIESEFYYLQIAGHKHPNSISGARALEISFLLVQGLQGPTSFTLFSIIGTDCLTPAHGEVVPSAGPSSSILASFSKNLASLSHSKISAMSYCQCINV